MSSFMEERREQRMASTDYSEELDARTYNIALGAVVLYGLVLNVIMVAALGDRMRYVNPIALIIGYIVSCIVGTLMSSKSDNPVISFIGYNLIVVPIGLVLSLTVEPLIRYGNGDIVKQAIVYTAVSAAVMIGLSIAFPDTFSKLGGILFGALIGLLIAGVISIFFFPGLQEPLAWVGAAIFALYIGYDYWRAQQYPKTLDNAVDSAVDIYLDIINLFLRILRVLGSRGGSSRRR